MTVKLTDLQRILLSTAAQRTDGSLLPPSYSISNQAIRIRKTIPSLIKRGLVEEADAIEQGRSWREEGGRRIGVVVTDAGREAVGSVPATEGPAVVDPAPDQPAAVATTQTTAPTKSAQVVALLQRSEGATLAELIAATGWLPHTTRAALTGLRKKGHAIARDTRDEATCYRIAAAA